MYVMITGKRVYFKLGWVEIAIFVNSKVFGSDKQECHTSF